MKAVIRWLAILVVLAIAFFGFRFYWNYEQSSLQSEFDRIAQTDMPSRFSEYSLICFNSNNGTERADFSKAAKVAGGDVDQSLKTCGVRNTCCEVESDVAGVIGLVRDRELECVPIKRFIYLIEGARELCVKPSRLKVTRDTFKSAFHSRGRPWIASSGDTYYKIEERHE